MKAKAVFALAGIQYKSKSEEDWAKIGKAMMEDDLRKPVVLWAYEPVTFNLPGNKYTPDFWYLMNDGTLVFVEVKGSRRQKNYRDSRSKLRMASKIHPYFMWYMATGKGMDWTLEKI